MNWTNASPVLALLFHLSILLVPLSDNIDLFVGGMAETPYLGSAKIGMTFLCIMVDQFTRLRDGDR